MIGEAIGQYQITGHLGSGGMGEVYLAVDSKLDREVALKFLPQEMAADGDVRARFLQEARAASALNHPNICTIHDIQEHDGRLFIVMEHIDGETLRDKKEKLSISQILEIGAQVADGLGAAHAKGIIHRDIKTENIMVRKDGIAQIMDFGLAKLRGVSRLTKEGSTLGTVGYMSPEQALGQDADHRTDIFSLGVVLYELLTGHLPFQGAHEAAIMYEIVNVDSPPPSSMRPEIDPELDRIVLECLQKEPTERYQSALEVAKDLRRFKRDSGRKRVSRVSTVRPSQSQIVLHHDTAPHVTVATSPAPKPSSSSLAWIIASVMAICAISLAILKFAWPEPAPLVTRADILPPPATRYETWGAGHLALSPDGTQLAFVGEDSVGGDSHLWVRPLNSAVAIPLPGTEGALFPFWSADSRNIGFFANEKLKRISASGGPSLTICDAPLPRGGSWNADDIIIFSPVMDRSLIHKVPAVGGEPVPISILDSTVEDFTHRWPHFLPDGKHYLFFARTVQDAGGEQDAICFGSLDGGIAKRLVRTRSNVAYANGYMIYQREQTLMAHPFDPDAGEFTGEAVPIEDNVSYDVSWSRGFFSASRNGRLVYQLGSQLSGSQLTMRDREGRVIDTIGPRATQYVMRLSPDEERLAISVLDDVGSNMDIWIHEVSRGIRTRFTFDSLTDYGPIWSPDGKQIAFGSTRNGIYGLWVKDAAGVREARLLLETEFRPQPSSWSADGRYIFYNSPDSSGESDIGILSTTGEQQPADWLTRTPFSEAQAELSPDGRWLAYMSTESGREQVYVSPFPGPGGKRQISVNEGDRPRWRADGKELFYLDNTDHIMVAEVDGSGTSFRVGDVRPLFQVVAATRPGTIYDVTGDGQRFFVNSTGAVQLATVTLVINWPEELKQR